MSTRSGLMSGKDRKSYGTAGNDSEYRVDFEGPGTSSSPIFFDAAQFYRLCDNITSNIFSLTKHANSLDRTLRAIGSKNDSKELRESVHNTHTIASKTITDTSTYLKQIDALVKNPRAPGGKEEKMRVTRLTHDFQQSVQRYSDLQKQILAKMKSNILPLSRSTSTFEGGDNEEHQESLIASEAERQAQLQLQEQLEFEQGMMIEREDRIRQIECDIVDINGIMRDLGEMVHEQGTMIDSIEGHIETTHQDVEDGTAELRKASAYQTTYRKRLFCLLGAGLAVLIVVIIILVTQLKS